MRLGEIITPKTSIKANSKQIAELLLRDCRPFLEQIDSRIKDYAMWRGINGKQEKFGKKTSRPRSREPRNTKQLHHDKLNGWFKTNFGHPYRNAVFATGSKIATDMYGWPYMIFPIGEFEFLWHPKVGDLYDITRNRFRVSVMDDLKDGYKTDDMKSAIFSRNEIMIWTREYYYLDSDVVGLVDEIGKYLS